MGPVQMETTMNISITSAALAGLLLAGTAADASAWTRQGTVTTWRGTYTVNGAGGCGGGVCSRTRTVTGPYGGTVTRSDTVVRTGPGQFRYQSQTTGPYGGTVTRSGTVVVNRPPY
jgi:hypothetical protein